MIRPILTYPDPRLGRRSADVAEDDFGTAKVYELDQDLRATMAAARGLGLSAVQVGELVRMFVIVATAPPGRPATVCTACNPEILERGPLVDMPEGCLSFPGVTEVSKAPSFVRARFRDVDGGRSEYRFDGIAAQAFAHEADHLDGKLLIDRMGPLKRRMFLKSFAKAQNAKR